MNYHEIIDETVKYYRTHKRGVQLNEIGSHQCMYKNDRGAKCAVGRCMTDDALEASAFGGFVGGADELWAQMRDVSDDITEFFKPEYRDLIDEDDPDFWTDLQNFHDKEHNWIAKGRGYVLSDIGKECIIELKSSWL